MKIHTKGKHDCMIMIIIKYISTKYPVGGWGWGKEGGWGFRYFSQLRTSLCKSGATSYNTSNNTSIQFMQPCAKERMSVLNAIKKLKILINI